MNRLTTTHTTYKLRTNKLKKMVSLNKSFIWGTLFASITWVISLYLYWQLTNALTNVSITTQLGSSGGHGDRLVIKRAKYKDTFNVIISNDINEPFKHKRKEDSKGIVEKKRRYYKKYFNSEKLIQSLQVVPPKSSIPLDKDLNELGMVKTVEDQKIRDDGYKLHAYNTLVSQALSYHRDVPDTRHKLCKEQKYSDNLAAASIIVCFYNEHFETLIRTVHSILDRSPEKNLQEIILVDDFSDIDDLHFKVKEYIDKNLSSRVRLIKTERREGLIRARMFGAKQATGKVIVFLDSHVEVNVKWLEPLLARIAESPTTVVMPIIDIINADTFAYTSSPIVRGGFNWGLHFKWENLPTGTLSQDEDFVKPIKSPTMAGGLFAMDHQYFKDLGEYDSGMDIWGGENLEISFRIWMCGGTLELIPCSRVGHIFRKRRPYGSPNGQDTMLHNSLRVAYVWMDEYKEHFFKQRPESKKISYGDITQRLNLRKELSCKTFSWYLSNVYPELVLPNDDDERLKKKWSALEQNKYQPWHSRKRNYQSQYQLRLTNSTLCIQSAKDEKTKGSSLVLETCLRTKSQMWYETDKNELVLAQLLCMEAGSSNVRLSKCHEMGGAQEWKHKGENRTPIYNMAAGTCLGVKEKAKGTLVTMEFCTRPDLNQWDLVR